MVLTLLLDSHHIAISETFVMASGIAPAFRIISIAAASRSARTPRRDTTPTSISKPVKATSQTSDNDKRRLKVYVGLQLTTL